MILIKCPGDLVEGARGGRKVVVVQRALGALRDGEGVARCFEGVDFFILHVSFTLAGKSRRLRAVTSGKDVAGLLLGGAIMQWRVVFAWLRQAVEAMQLSTHAIQTVGKAVRKVLRCGLTPHKNTTSCSLGETGTPAKTQTQNIYTCGFFFPPQLSNALLKSDFCF